MKIVHVAPPFLALDENMKYGGIERVIMSLVKKERCLVDDVKIIAPSDSNIMGLVPTVKSIGVDDIYSPSIDREAVRQNSLSKIAHIAKVLEFSAENYDSILHFHDDYFAPFMRQISSRALLTLHSPYEEFWMTEEFPEASAQAKNLIAISRKQGEIYSSHGFNMRSVVYNGIEVDTFPFSAETGSFLLSLSGILPHKGQHLALEFAKSAGLDLVIAGNIANQEYFDRMIRPNIQYDLSNEEDKLGAYRMLGKGPKAVFVGPVNDEQKKPLYAAAKAFIMPVLWEEPFGLVAIEALACGTPVIASNRGALPELIDVGRTGFLCGSDSDFVDAISNIGSLDRLACRKVAESRFSSDAMARSYIEIYKNL
jgi:glycosyltransferase involved in cell wall biosynthesis